jgi:predicted flap endonuclease-1-like 5' DNA nuclease
MICFSRELVGCMISATFLPLLTAIIGLIAGVMIGWALFALRRRRIAAAADATPLDLRLDQLRALADEKRTAIADSEAMLDKMEKYLATLSKDVAAAREQVSAKDREYKHLLSTLDERRASIEDAHGSVRASLDSREKETESLLTNIDKSLEEIDMLNELQETYTVKINRLTQQVQWHDSELRMLQQTAQTKSAEIEEARALLDQRDAELRRMIRQRQQREIDLEHVKQTLAQRNEELRQLLHQQAQSEAASRSSRQISAPPDEERILIPPRKRQPMLPTPAIIDTQVSNPQYTNGADDLTQIPGLAEFYAAQLRSNGIRTFQQLANASPDDIHRMLDNPGHFSPNIARWIEAARMRTDYNADDTSRG